MANRLSSGPLQITTLDLPSINYMLQVVRRELDELKGLRGTSLIHGDVTLSGDIVADNIAFAPVASIQSVSGTASAGTSSLFPRADHVHLGVKGLLSGATVVDPDVTTGKITFTGNANSITLTPTTAAIDVKVKDAPTIVGPITISQSAGSPNFVITATSDVPTTTFTAGGTIHMSLAPAGFLEIQVGALPRYIPFFT